MLLLNSINSFILDAAKSEHLPSCYRWMFQTLNCYRSVHEAQSCRQAAAGPDPGLHGEQHRARCYAIQNPSVPSHWAPGDSTFMPINTSSISPPNSLKPCVLLSSSSPSVVFISPSSIPVEHTPRRMGQLWESHIYSVLMRQASWHRAHTFCSPRKTHLQHL